MVSDETIFQLTVKEGDYRQRLHNGCRRHTRRLLSEKNRSSTSIINIINNIIIKKIHYYCKHPLFDAFFPLQSPERSYCFELKYYYYGHEDSAYILYTTYIVYTYIGDLKINIHGPDQRYIGKMI